MVVRAFGYLGTALQMYHWKPRRTLWHQSKYFLFLALFFLWYSEVSATKSVSEWVDESGVWSILAGQSLGAEDHSVRTASERWSPPEFWEPLSIAIESEYSCTSQLLSWLLAVTCGKDSTTDRVAEDEESSRWNIWICLPSCTRFATKTSQFGHCMWCGYP